MADIDKRLAQWPSPLTGTDTPTPHYSSLLIRVTHARRSVAASRASGFDNEADVIAPQSLIAGRTYAAVPGRGSNRQRDAAATGETWIRRARVDCHIAPRSSESRSTDAAVISTARGPAAGVIGTSGRVADGAATERTGVIRRTVARERRRVGRQTRARIETRT